MRTSTRVCMCMCARAFACSCTNLCAGHGALVIWLWGVLSSMQVPQEDQDAIRADIAAVKESAASEDTTAEARVREAAMRRP